jgi:hypothetical protein
MGQGWQLVLVNSVQFSLGQVLLVWGWRGGPDGERLGW